MSRSTIALILLVLVAGAPLRAALPPEESTEHDGKRAAAFKLDTTDGRTVGLDQLKGKTVMLTFFASWCPPCRSETGELKKLLGKFGARGLSVVGAAVDKIQNEDTKPEDEKKDVADYVQEMKPGYPIGIASREMAQAYSFKGIPTTVVIGPDGKIVRTFLGFHTAAKFEAVLGSTLGKSPAAGH